MLETAEALFAQQTALVRKSEDVARRVKQLMMQSTSGAPTAAQAPKEGTKGARVSGLRVKRPAAAALTEEMTAAKRQKYVEMVSKLHQGGNALRLAALHLSEALIGPGVSFTFNKTKYVVVGVAANGEWECKQGHGRSEKTITRTAKEINEHLSCDAERA